MQQVLLPCVPAAVTLVAAACITAVTTHRLTHCFDALLEALLWLSLLQLCFEAEQGLC